ncbi:uncharacterized protein PV07_10522 [Cladophialophora immunda]|uniref:C2H2-type domain-containing protein n=1 Tax=Cladophialophora immunda TaxID=569365 RepID=A0A0D2AIU7_9EURO|nr:uncharacterized protein PV07_10522 [Cladophialophora immunda]KIW24832.1 hypothetical protein PV07_10522 [Cladophialophora immunda]
MSRDQDTFFDLERDILAPSRSPLLEPVNPKYEPRYSPAPLVGVSEQSSDSSEAEDTKAVRHQARPIARKGRANRTFADGLLNLSLCTLASQAQQEPMDARSQSEEEEQEEGEAQASQRQRKGPRRVIRHGANLVRTKSRPVTRTALLANPDGPDDDDDFPMISSPVVVPEEQRVRPPPKPEQAIQKPKRQAQAFHTASKQVDLFKTQFNIIHGDQDDDSILKSHILGKYAISPRDAHPDSTLPAIQQRSPARYSPAGLANYMTLPSLDRLGLCPSMIRPLSSQFATHASPGPPSYSNSWTTAGNSKASAFPDYTSSIITPSSGPSSLTALHERDREEQEEDSRTQHFSAQETDLKSQGEVRFIPQTQPTARSKPQSHHQSPPEPEPQPSTSAESQTNPDTESQFSELESELESQPELEPEPQSKSQPKCPSVSQSGVAGNAAARAHFSLGRFKCTSEGCNAPPFHTQYLLNSHMNVHSNERTHFCPVKDCPRGYGGLGFKRKNEMIRHGLVHRSPGYICPFCPDQQHRYPRPDNLKRHVRQHHSAEDRLDPRLRKVLNQNTDGNNKAGKRRTWNP